MKLFMFPGQGSQYVGMGLDLFRANDPLFLELIEIGSATLGYSLKKMMLEGPLDTLKKSASLQPAISAISLAYYNRLLQKGITPDVVMGHSLGEITALTAAGVLSAQQVVEFAAFRGKEMDRSAELMGGGGMWAVLLGDAETVIDALKKSGVSEDLFMANDNAPTQTVIAGKESAFEVFKKYCDEHMRVRFQKIDVAGPWHTPFITPGRDAFEQWVSSVELSDATVPFIMNGPAKVVGESAHIKSNITEQLIKPVYWRESLETALAMGGDEMYEVGAGTILKGLLRANKINRKRALIYSVDSLHALKNL